MESIAATFVRLTDAVAGAERIAYPLAELNDMRIGEEFQDREHVAAVLARYYPLDRYPPKARYVLEDLIGGGAE